MTGTEDGGAVPEPHGFELDAEDRDVITEVINIGVGRAAAALSQLIGEEVRLVAPTMEILSRAAAAGHLGTLTGNNIMGVRQDFVGPLTGIAALVFPERRSLEIVRAVVANSPALEDISELEQETLLEIGNILLNNCLGTISNILGVRSTASLPVLVLGTAEEIFCQSSEGGEGLVLFLHIAFSVRSQDVTGYLTFLLDFANAGRFIELIRDHLEKTIEAHAVSPGPSQMCPSPKCPSPKPGEDGS